MNPRILVLVSLVLVGCSDMQPTPVAPSPSVIVVQQPTQPVSTAPPFAITIGANGGDNMFTDAPFQTSVTVSGPADPSIITVNCNNGSELQAYPGRRGSIIITCAFPVPGSYPIVATAVDRTSGFQVSARTDVNVSVRPEPPKPPAPPALALAAFRGTVVADQSEQWTFTASGTGFESYVWDFGDNRDNQTTKAGTTVHTYVQAGGYKATVTGVRANGETVKATRDVLVRLN